MDWELSSVSGTYQRRRRRQKPASQGTPAMAFLVADNARSNQVENQ